MLRIQIAVFFSASLLALEISTAAVPLTDAQELSRAGMPAIALPKIPDRSFNIADFGAVGDGKTLNTSAIQNAIDACDKAGGGSVRIPSGKYLSAPIKLSNNLDLHLDKGAVLLFTNKLSDVPISTNRYANFLYAENRHDISVTGEGTIDGQGDIWWTTFMANPNMPRRPYILAFSHCQRILIDGITLTNSPSFHLVPHDCSDVTIDNVTIYAPETAKNTDGMDPSGKRIIVNHCTVDSGDDCVVFKPSLGKTDDIHPAVQDTLVVNCTFKHGHGMSVGGQSDGGMRHMVVRDCTFDSTDAGIRLKAPRGRGGLVEDLVYQNLTMHDVKYAISFTSYYPENTTPADLATAAAQPVKPSTPIWRNITIDNVTATGGENAGRIIGLPEMPFSDLKISNVHISAEKPLVIAEAKDVQFSNSQIKVTAGAPLQLIHAQITGINPQTGK